MKDKKKTGRFPWVSFVFGTLFLALAFFLSFAVEWYAETYGLIGFDAILYTLTADLGGVDGNLIASFTAFTVPKTLVSTMCCSALLFFRCRRKLTLKLFDKYSIRLYPLSKRVSSVLAAAIGVMTLISAADKSELIKFLYYAGNPSTFYEDHYVDPKEVAVTFPEEKRNLIFIFLESMETSFFSEEEGGARPYNVIPELHQLARENVNFSDHEQVGGFIPVPGTTWTVGAMVGQTAGIPMKTPLGVDQNSYGQDGVFLPGVTTIMDILRDNGYYQAAMFGSNAGFGGRLQYYTSHGADRIYDLQTAAEDGIVPEGYHNGFWGMEDAYLMEYAKRELRKMADAEQPFAFTMLTVDTHHVDGYFCEQCESEFAEQYENVFRCSSRQVYAFVQWIQQQDFYDNTTIVIAGDHPSMDGEYIAQNVGQRYDRKVYNCMINPAVDVQNTKNRLCSTLDMFPTTLAAIGCEIEGERLGLGTNLFSQEKSLMEEMGRTRMEDEISRYSEFYFNQFF